MNGRTEPPASWSNRAARRLLLVDPTASSTTRTRTPALARAASASTTLRPVASSPRMNMVRSIVRRDAAMSSMSRAYARSPFSSSSKRCPARAGGAPSATRTRATGPGEARSLREGAVRMVRFAVRGNFRAPTRK